MNPSCSLFGINIHLRYLKKSVKINNTVISVKEFSAISGENYNHHFNHYTHSLKILLYRKDNFMQLYDIDGNFNGDKELKNVFENVLLVNLQNKLKTYSNNSIQWVWEKPIYIGSHFARNPLNNNHNIYYASILTLLLIDIINNNFNTHDVLRAIVNPIEINTMTEYLRNMMISLERYFKNLSYEHYMCFLNNYSRYILQYILFTNNRKSLSSFFVHDIENNKKTLKNVFIKKPNSHPFIIKKLSDILNDEIYSSNTNNIILILKRFFVFEKINLRVLGINFNHSNSTDILNKKQKNNNVRYYNIPRPLSAESTDLNEHYENGML